MDSENSLNEEIQTFDIEIDGVKWSRTKGKDEFWFTIVNEENIKIGSKKAYRKNQNEKKSWKEWNDISVMPALCQTELDFALSGWSHDSQIKWKELSQERLEEYQNIVIENGIKPLLVQLFTLTPTEQRQKVLARLEPAKGKVKVMPNKEFVLRSFALNNKEFKEVVEVDIEELITYWIKENTLIEPRANKLMDLIEGKLGKRFDINKELDAVVDNTKDGKAIFLEEVENSHYTETEKEQFRKIFDNEKRIYQNLQTLLKKENKFNPLKPLSKDWESLLKSYSHQGQAMGSYQVINKDSAYETLGLHLIVHETMHNLADKTYQTKLQENDLGDEGINEYFSRLATLTFFKNPLSKKHLEYLGTPNGVPAQSSFYAAQGRGIYGDLMNKDGYVKIEANMQKVLELARKYFLNLDT